MFTWILTRYPNEEIVQGILILNEHSFQLSIRFQLIRRGTDLGFSVRKIPTKTNISNYIYNATVIKLGLTSIAA